MPRWRRDLQLAGEELRPTVPEGPVFVGVFDEDHHDVRRLDSTRALQLTAAEQSVLNGLVHQHVESLLAAAETLTAHLSQPDRDAIFGGTAAQFYGVP